MQTAHGNPREEVKNSEVVNAVRMATILDCEGWITLQKLSGKGQRGVGLVLVIGVGNTNEDLTDWLKTAFGGSIYHTKRPAQQHKDYYTWRLFGNNACEILKLVQPYMLLKKAQVDLAIRFQETMHSKNTYNEPCTPEYVAEMWTMKYHMAILNRKGKTSPAETNRENTKPALVAGGEVIVRPSAKTEELSRNVEARVN